MALDRLKKQLNQKAVRDAEALREKRASDFEKESEFDDYKKQQLSALHCLQQLEDFFWECADDFSKLEKLQIYHSNRPKKSWWNSRPKKSLLTIANPSLYHY